ncbi:MAG: hypothetical protein KDC71_23455, partial [Acidobacteria bacterium]|nr:hypothetical protein [Acidobacteriota bacterium]
MHLSDTDLDQRLTAIEARLSALENAQKRGVSTQPFAHPEPAEHSEQEWAPSGENISRFATHLGRTFLVFAGAFLLRAFTKSGALPPALGVLLGFAYAMSWLYFAYRQTRVRPWSASFHAITSVLLALPIIVEAILHFAALTPVLGCIWLVLTLTVFLVLARRTDIHLLAWAGVLGGLLASAALYFETKHLVLFSLPPLYLTLAATWLGYARELRWLRWPAALMANLMLFIALQEPAGETARTFYPFSAIAVQIIALAIPWLFFALFRTIDAQGRPTRKFAHVQGSLALLIGISGASHLSGFGLGLMWVGGLSFALAISAYQWTLMQKEQNTGVRVFSSTMAFIAVVLAALYLPNKSVSVVILTVLIWVLAFFAKKRTRAELNLQAGLLVWTALMIGGTALWIFQTFTMWDKAPGWPNVIAGILPALAAVSILVFSTPAPKFSWRVFPAMTAWLVVSAALLS